MKKLFTYLLIAFISLIVSCQPSAIKYVGNESTLAIDSTKTENANISKLIQPYKTKLDAEMNEVLVISAEEFPKESGKPETKLGNLVADLSFSVAYKLYNPSDKIDIGLCMLNFGGLRTSLPKGEITRGKIFELMPFENELVVVSITKNKYIELIEYLGTNPQPISGFTKFSFNSDGYKEYPDTEVWTENTHPPPKDYYIKILTTDYLAKGGDNMTFFANPIKYEKVGIKLRDAIIQYCIEQHAQGKQLTGKIEGRIIYE